MSGFSAFALKVLTGNGGGSSGGKFVGSVTNKSSAAATGVYYNAFPTARLDGSALQNEDFVRVHSSATPPFTIAGKTFSSNKAVGYYYSGNWVVQEGVVTETTEIALKNKLTESVSGTETNQAQANAGFVTEFGKKVDRVVTEDSGAKSIIDNQKGQHGAVIQSMFGDTIVSFNTADENGEDGIVGQIYAKSKDTNQGARLNIKKAGMFYGKGTSASTEAGEEIATLGDVDKRVLQLSTMPTASATYLNKIVQFTGTTDTNYTNGYFYTAYLDGTTYKWKNVPVQSSASGDKKNAYSSIKQHADYLFEMQYTQENMDQEYAYNVFSSASSDPIYSGACTGVYYNKKVLRQYDWYYDNLVDFLVRVAPEKVTGKYGSVAMCGAIPYFTKDAVGKETYNEKYKIVPFTVIDGINEHGLFFQQNVVPKKIEDINITHTSTEYKGKITTNMIGRILLDNCKTVSEVADELAKYDITRPVRMPAEYDSHYLICDSTGAHKILEFKYNGQGFQLVSYGSTYEVMTNFNMLATNGISTDGQLTLNWDNISTDSEHNAGLERFELCATEVKKANPSLESLRSKLNYTNSYISTTDPFWYTEYCGMENELGHILSPYLAKNHPEEFTQTVAHWQDRYNNRTREDTTEQTWQTVHSVIYDLSTKTMELSIQERDNEIQTIYFNNEKDEYDQYVEVHPFSGIVPEHEVLKLKNNKKNGIVYEYNAKKYLLERVQKTVDDDTTMTFLCSKKNDAEDRLEFLFAYIQINPSDPNYCKITNQLITSSGSIIADEKTIITNALGKIETALGGYPEEAHYEVFKDPFTKETDIKFKNTLLTWEPFRHEETTKLVHFTGTLVCRDFGGADHTIEIDRDVLFSWIGTNTYKSDPVAYGCSFTLCGERATPNMTVLCEMSSFDYEKIMSCNILGEFNGILYHKINTDYIPIDNQTIGVSSSNLIVKENGLDVGHFKESVVDKTTLFKDNDTHIATSKLISTLLDDKQHELTIGTTEPATAAENDLFAKDISSYYIKKGTEKLSTYTAYKSAGDYCRHESEPATTRRHENKFYRAINGATIDETGYTDLEFGFIEWEYVVNMNISYGLANGSLEEVTKDEWSTITTDMVMGKVEDNVYAYKTKFIFHYDPMVYTATSISDGVNTIDWGELSTADVNNMIADGNVDLTTNALESNFLYYKTDSMSLQKFDWIGNFTIVEVPRFELYIYDGAKFVKVTGNDTFSPDETSIKLNTSGLLAIKEQGIQFAHFNNDIISIAVDEDDPSGEKIPTESAVSGAINSRQRVVTISDTQPTVCKTKDLWAKKVTTEVIMHSGNKVVDYTPYKLEQNFVRYEATSVKDYSQVFYTANGTAEVTEYSVKLSGGDEYLYADITDALLNSWIASGEISPCPPSFWEILTTGTNGFSKSPAGAYEFMSHWEIHINPLAIEDTGIMDSDTLKPWATITPELVNGYVTAENVLEAGSLAAGTFLCYTTGNETNKFDHKNHFTATSEITYELYIYAESLWRQIGTSSGTTGGFIPDSVTINLNSLNKLQIKDGGITKSKLATDLIATEIDEDSTDDTIPTSKAVTDKLYAIETTNFTDETLATEGQLSYEESTDEKIPTCLAVQHYAKNFIASWMAAMPYAGSDYEDRIIQYTGEDTVEFANGRFYRCVNSATEGYKWKEVMVNEIKDTLESQLTTASLSANQGYVLKGLIDGMAGVVKVSVVATQPTSPENNTIYYIGTAAPYEVKLYTTDEGWTELGTTEVELTDYCKVEDIVDNCESTATNKPLSANQGKLIKDVLDKKLKTMYKITAPTTLDQFFTDCNFEDDKPNSSHGYAVNVATGILPLDENSCDFQLWQQDKDNRSIIVIIKDGKMYNRTKQSGSWDESWASYVTEGTATVDITANNGTSETKFSLIAGDGAYIDDNKVLTAGNSALVDTNAYTNCTKDFLFNKMSGITAGAMMFSNVKFTLRESPNGSNSCSYSILIIKKDSSNCTILCQYAYEGDTYVCTKYSGGWQSWVKLLNPNDTSYVKIYLSSTEATRQRILDLMSASIKTAIRVCDVDFTASESPDGKATSKWTVIATKRYIGYATYLAQKILDDTGAYSGEIYTCACNDGVFSNWKQVRMTDNNTFSTLTVTGATALKGTTTVSEALTCSKTLKVAGTATMAAITASGSIYTSSSLTVLASSSLANVTASGAMVVNNTFKATGAATLSSTLTVSGAATLSSNLTVGGNTKTSTLTVTGDSNVNLLQSSNKLVIYGSQPSIMLKTTTDERTDIYIKNKSDQIFAAIRVQANDALEIGRMRDGVWYDGAEVILRKNGNFEIRSNDGSNVGVLKGVGNALYWNSKRIG